jgi:hypothetical protein
MVSDGNGYGDRGTSLQHHLARCLREGVGQDAHEVHESILSRSIGQGGL